MGSLRKNEKASSAIIKILYFGLIKYHNVVVFVD
jgi:hypothetical protein